jgi:hypothetical protein
MPATFRSRVKTLSRKLGRDPATFTIDELTKYGIHVPNQERKNSALFQEELSSIPWAGTQANMGGVIPPENPQKRDQTLMTLADEA